MIRIAAVLLASVFARTAIAQSPVKPAATIDPVGTWRGTSVCLVRPSPCNDEIVAYRVAPMKAADSVTVDARTIVDGNE